MKSYLYDQKSIDTNKVSFVFTGVVEPEFHIGLGYVSGH
jgi:hypothetical protein